jgi:hypothetical protein
MTSRPPFAAGRTLVGARFIVPSRSKGRGVATPLPFVRPAADTTSIQADAMSSHPYLRQFPPPGAATRHLKRVIRSKGDRKVCFGHVNPRQPSGFPMVPPLSPASAFGRDVVTITSAVRRRANPGRGTIHRALLIGRARRSHAPTLRPPSGGHYLDPGGCDVIASLPSVVASSPPGLWSSGPRGL